MVRTERVRPEVPFSATTQGALAPYILSGRRTPSCREIPALRGLPEPVLGSPTMSTAPFAHPGPGAVVGSQWATRETDAKAPGALAAALMIAIVYAAFAHGAVSSPAEPRLQVALAAVAALAAGAWLWTGTLRIAAPRLATGGRRAAGAFARLERDHADLERRTGPDLDRAQPHAQLRARALPGARAGCLIRACDPGDRGRFLARRARGQLLRTGAEAAARACTSPASSTSTRPVSSRACRNRSATGMRSRCSSRWVSRPALAVTVDQIGVHGGCDWQAWSRSS